jgi:hypothetical protein
MRASKEEAGLLTHWLIAKHGVSGMEVLTIRLGGGAEEALAVFTIEDEARAFLDSRFGASGEGWEARRTWPGELASVLLGPCSAAKRVVLDPSPEAAEKGKSARLRAVDRGEFLGMLLGGETARGPAVSTRSLGSGKGLARKRVAYWHLARG